MQKPNIFVIILRYILVAVLAYYIWIGNMLAIKICLTLVIFHSESIFVSNKMKEAHALSVLKKRKASNP